MSSIYTLLLVIQIISAFVIIGLVLMQHGKGADMGSSFGSGSAGSLFGATGAANFLSRTTKWAAVLFFAVTTGLAYFSYAPSRAQQQAHDAGVMQGYEDRSVPQLGDTPVTNLGGASAVPSVGDIPAAPAPAPAPAPAAVPQAPAMEAPAMMMEAPAAEAPAEAEQAPAEPAPAVEAPVEEAPAEEAPADADSAP